MNKLLKKTDVARKESYGQPRSLQIKENTELVEEMILRQEDQLGTDH